MTKKQIPLSRFRLSDMMVGANMEDLHYQMVGGFDSQMLHGESFFEHSPTELAPHFARIAGFANTEGRWTAGNGILRVNLGGVPPTRWIDGFIQGGRELPTVRDQGQRQPATADAEQAVVAAVGSVQQRIGTRLTSLALAPADTVEISASFNFPAGSQNTASLISHIDPNHSDSGSEWYAGYTVELNPLDGTVVLRVARKANSHDEVARAEVTIAAGKWIPVRLRVEAGKAIVDVDGARVITKELPYPLPIGLYGIVTRENIQVRDLALVSAAGRITTIPFATSPLLKQPGDALSLRWARVRTGKATGEFSFNPDGWHAGLRSQQVTYCNAPNGTPAGDRRKADGYARPFAIRYLQIANESGVNANYAGYFQRVAKAIWKVAPDIILVPAGNVYNCSGRENEADMRKRLDPHLQITRFVHDNGKELLWDFHAFNTNDDPGQALGGAVPGGIAFSQWLSRLAPECGVVPVA